MRQQADDVVVCWVFFTHAQHISKAVRLRVGRFLLYSVAIMEHTLEQKTSSVLKWTLIVAITLVLNLFVGYAVSVVYQEPQYQNFCQDNQVNQVFATKSECLSVGGQWNETSAPQAMPDSAVGVKVTAPDVTAYCNPTYTCENNYEAAQKLYDRNVFATLVVLGVIMIVLGFAFKANEVLSYGFSFGGVFSFLIASLRYWSSADSLVKVLILGAALAALIYLAYKKFSVKVV